METQEKTRNNKTKSTLFLWSHPQRCLEMLNSLPPYQASGTICMSKQATKVLCEQATELGLLSTCRFYLLAQVRPKGAKRGMVRVWRKSCDFYIITCVLGWPVLDNRIFLEMLPRTPPCIHKTTKSEWKRRKTHKTTKTHGKDEKTMTISKTSLGSAEMMHIMQTALQYQASGTICTPKQATAVDCMQATEPSLLPTCRFYLLAQARPKGAKRWMV